MRGRFPQRIHDAIEMILRVGLHGRRPRDLIAENYLPIDYRRRLAVAGAQVKPDAASFEMPAQGPSLGALRRDVPGLDQFQRMIEHPLADHIRIKFAGWRFLPTSEQLPR